MLDLKLVFLKPVRAKEDIPPLQAALQRSESKMYLNTGILSTCENRNENLTGMVWLRHKLVILEHEYSEVTCELCYENQSLLFACASVNCYPH